MDGPQALTGTRVLTIYEAQAQEAFRKLSFISPQRNMKHNKL